MRDCPISGGLDLSSQGLPVQSVRIYSLGELWLRTSKYDMAWSPWSGKESALKMIPFGTDSSESAWLKWLQMGVRKTLRSCSLEQGNILKQLQHCVLCQWGLVTCWALTVCFMTAHHFPCHYALCTECNQSMMMISIISFMFTFSFPSVENNLDLFCAVWLDVPFVHKL